MKTVRKRSRSKIKGGKRIIRNDAGFRLKMGQGGIFVHVGGRIIIITYYTRSSPSSRYYSLIKHFRCASGHPCQREGVTAAAAVAAATVDTEGNGGIHGI